MRKDRFSPAALAIATASFCFYLAAAFAILIVTYVPALAFNADDWSKHI